MLLARLGAAGGFVDRVRAELLTGPRRFPDLDTVARAMAGAGLELDDVLKATSWNKAKIMLDANAQAMINAGHWGVPLMVYRDDPFYGQDRFDQMIWRMRLEREAV